MGIALLRRETASELHGPHVQRVLVAICADGWVRRGVPCGSFVVLWMAGGAQEIPTIACWRCYVVAGADWWAVPTLRYAGLMADYRGYFVAGGTYFFTRVAYRRRE